MVQVTPTSAPAISVVAMRRLVAASSTFQTLLGVATAAAAMERIYLYEAADEADEGAAAEEPQLTQRRPRVIIQQELGTERTGAGTWKESGTLFVTLEAVPPAIYQAHDDQAIWFANLWGNIFFVDCRNNSGGSDGTNPYANITSFRPVLGPMSCDDDLERQFFWVVVIECNTR